MADDPTGSRFAQAMFDLARGELPEEVAAHGHRTMLNALAVAVGASHHAAVEIVVGLGLEHGGRPTVKLPGRVEELDGYHAALAIGLAAHVDDYDDTHLQTVIHPGAAALAVSLAVGQWRGASGARVMSAFILACEAQLRVGLALTPRHFQAGWHVTGTSGVIGAAVGAGLLCGLNGEQLADAIGIAASQTVGLRVAHGTMIKAAHPGKAAANGLLAALLAERGFSGPAGGLQAPRGYFEVLTDHACPRALLDGLGERWELSRNTFKPYPSGVVTHPIIDAGLALASQLKPRAEIEAVEVRCHPLVLELTAQPQPSSGLMARFSAPHAVAVALLDGVVGLEQFSDARATDQGVARLRGLVKLIVDERVASDEAIVTVRLADGRELERHVCHARGSLAHPLDDAELDAKVRALVEPVLPGRTDRIVDALYGLPLAADLGLLWDAVTPAAQRRA